MLWIKQYKDACGFFASSKSVTNTGVNRMKSIMLIVVKFIPLVYQEIESDCFRKLLDLKPITESTATKI